MTFKKVILDIEANNLIGPLLDYSSMPYKFKDDFKVWCIVLRCVDTQQTKVLIPKDYMDYFYEGLPEDPVYVSYNLLDKIELSFDNLKNCLSSCEELILHNGVKYDLPFLKLAGLLEYEVGYPIVGLDDFKYKTTIFNKEVKIIDTLLISKLLNPDRFGGHSLQAWGDFLGNEKIDFHDFSKYSIEMVNYCVQDTSTTYSIYNHLIDDFNSWNWLPAYTMEIKLADLTLKQELFGFHFDSKLAEDCLVEFDSIMESIRNSVNPQLPPKPLNKGEQKLYTLPKIQFKSNGEPSAVLLKFVEKLGGTIDENSVFHFEGREYQLPYNGCVKESLDADIDDLDHLKAYLLDLGWTPLEWKERDLTKDAKKIALVGDKLIATIQRYVNSTLTGPYKKYRLNLLDVTEDKLEKFLLSQISSSGRQAPIRVPVSPQLRVGTEKSLCPNLEKMEKSEFAKLVTKYLTYRHRRNSIAGGKEDDDGEPLTGFLSLVREDGRVPTPADTLGANTGRYRHIGVANIPRVTSIAGDKMRALFGAGPDFDQLGFDFASLEARVQGHYVTPFKDGEQLAETLVAEKPNDIHCFSEDTEILTATGWQKYSTIHKNSLVAQWCEKTKNITYANPSEIITSKYDGDMISISGLRANQLVTPNHRIVLYNIFTREYEVFEAKELQHLKNKDYYILPTYGQQYQSDSSISSLISKIRSPFIEIVPTGKGFKVTSYVLQDMLDVCEICHLHNRHADIYEKINPQTDAKIYQTFISYEEKNLKGAFLKHLDIRTTSYSGNVWCVSVPTSFVVIRRNNKISISGNSINAAKLGITRDAAKSFTYAVMYGAAVGKLAKMLGVSTEEAERLFEAYWEAVPSLKELKEFTEESWKNNKNYIVGLDGRKLFVRSQHSLINVLFQGGGACLAKWSTVLICKFLEQKDLLGNPLIHSKDDLKVYLMIAYHDECQFAVSKSLLNHHNFSNPELYKQYLDLVANSDGSSKIENPVELLAKEAKKQFKDSSDITHDSNGNYHFTENNIVSHTILKAISETCSYLQLRVPLGMAWATGKNWAECH